MTTEPYCRAILRILDRVTLELAWDGEAWRFHTLKVFGMNADLFVTQEDRERRFETIEAAASFSRILYQGSARDRSRPEPELHSAMTDGRAV